MVPSIRLSTTSTMAKVVFSMSLRRIILVQSSGKAHTNGGGGKLIRMRLSDQNGPASQVTYVSDDEGKVIEESKVDGSDKPAFEDAVPI